MTNGERAARHLQQAGDIADMLLKAFTRGELDREFCIQILLNHAAITRSDHFDEIIEKMRAARE